MENNEEWTEDYRYEMESLDERLKAFLPMSRTYANTFNLSYVGSFTLNDYKDMIDAILDQFRQYGLDFSVCGPIPFETPKDVTQKTGMRLSEHYRLKHESAEKIK
ncbi:MAG: hypothetical protein VZR00_04910 [Lachnospiraceae bacterium]|jgi:hypothetical protein|nr:hypothetical protein [Lachnospiraceae bacterium]MEE3461217.1 hypothetical protein [Lachnospiraceae bacterium]